MSAERMCECQCRDKTILQLQWKCHCDNHSDISTILTVIKGPGLICRITVSNIYS
jgi:hypothetical protein